MKIKKEGEREEEIVKGRYEDTQRYTQQESERKRDARTDRHERKADKHTYIHASIQIKR